MTFDERAYEHEFKLNDTDDLVIEYIQKNRENIQNISIHKIAEELYLSPNSIMRLAKKLGYSGFSELKFSIQNEETPNETYTVENRVLHKIPQNIVKTMDVIDDEIMKKFVVEMQNSHKTMFAGIGDSVYFCELLGRYLRCFDKRVEYFAQIHDIEYASRFYCENDLIIVISASGNVPRLVKLVNSVKRRNPDTKVFCITHYGKNSLSEVCDSQLCFWGEKRVVNGFNVTDRAGLAMLIRMLCETYIGMITSSSS